MKCNCGSHNISILKTDKNLKIYSCTDCGEEWYYGKELPLPKLENITIIIK